MGGNRWNNHRWNLDAHPTEFSAEALGALPLDKMQYHWIIGKLENSVFESQRPLIDDVRDYETTVENFIARLDNYLYGLLKGGDRMTPEHARARFESMNSGLGGHLFLPRNT